jgi:DnaJ-class molecular chaperone
MQDRFKNCGKCHGVGVIAWERGVECDFCDGSGSVDRNEFYEPEGIESDTWKEAAGVA